MFFRRSRGLLACIALVAGNAEAQSSAPAKCESKEFRAFDFWIGEWRVTWKTPQGQPAEGRNSIRRILDGCAVEEDWKGGDGSHGQERDIPRSDREALASDVDRQHSTAALSRRQLRRRITRAGGQDRRRHH